MFFVILVTHPKSYVETTDRCKPSKWRWGWVISWKIQNFCSVGGARSKNSIFTFYRIPFIHSFIHNTNIIRTLNIVTTRQRNSKLCASGCVEAWNIPLYEVPVSRKRPRKEVRLQVTLKGGYSSRVSDKRWKRAPDTCPSNRSITSLPGLAGSRTAPFWILLELRMMEVVSGDNWSYKMCEAPVKLSPPTNQHQTFPDFTISPVLTLYPAHSLQETVLHETNGTDGSSVSLRLISVGADHLLTTTVPRIFS